MEERFIAPVSLASQSGLTIEAGPKSIVTVKLRLRERTP
jgi:hypothetical protein